MGEMQATRELMLENVNSFAAAASIYPKLQKTLSEPYCVEKIEKHFPLHHILTKCLPTRV